MYFSLCEKLCFWNNEELSSLKYELTYKNILGKKPRKIIVHFSHFSFRQIVFSARRLICITYLFKERWLAVLE